MRSGADLLWFLFSASGLISALIATGVWVLLARRSRAPRVALLLVIAFYAIAGWYPVSRSVSRRIEAEYAHALTASDVPSGSTAVVLLGSGSDTFFDWDSHIVSLPDPIGMERTLEAARVFTLLNASYLVSAGGQALDEAPREPAAVSMQTVLIWLGVPADRIVLERESRNTHDQALAIKRLLPSLNVEHIVLVTSSIHMRRSLGAFRAAGINAFPAAARETEYDLSLTLRLLPSAVGLRESALAAHEIAGYFYYKRRGWL
ncbi:MAG: YdcF family protein [Acidobacteriaceae bacterium]|jgi:uncharacterized SAM-binding protein YcdF (DUF218 family)|nr:YdcF family protein [Acidobacteriaceae bacterium]